MSHYLQRELDAHRAATPSARKADVYVENGYASRADYLSCLAEDYGVDQQTVQALADLLGPNEDFDGLVISLEDM